MEYLDTSNAPMIGVETSARGLIGRTHANVKPMFSKEKYIMDAIGQDPQYKKKHYLARTITNPIGAALLFGAVGAGTGMAFKRLIPYLEKNHTHDLAQAIAAQTEERIMQMPAWLRDGHRARRDMMAGILEHGRQSAHNYRTESDMTYRSRLLRDATISGGMASASALAARTLQPSNIITRAEKNKKLPRKHKAEQYIRTKLREGGFLEGKTASVDVQMATNAVLNHPKVISTTAKVTNSKLFKSMNSTINQIKDAGQILTPGTEKVLSHPAVRLGIPGSNNVEAVYRAGHAINVATARSPKFNSWYQYLTRAFAT